jgi:hypothetical protein
MSGSTGEAMSTSVTFIVRAARTADGRLAGVVERVRTGEKHRFDDPSAIGRLIDRMIDEEACGPEQGAGSRDP